MALDGPTMFSRDLLTSIVMFVDTFEAPRALGRVRTRDPRFPLRGQNAMALACRGVALGTCGVVTALGLVAALPTDAVFEAQAVLRSIQSGVKFKTTSSFIPLTAVASLASLAPTLLVCPIRRALLSEEGGCRTCWVAFVSP